MKFFQCNLCGNLIGMIHNSGRSLVCCDQPMQEILSNINEASLEKHLPVIEKQGNIVKVLVGSVPHPMAVEHQIEWIYLQTKEGAQRKTLTPENTPIRTFALAEGDEVIAAYAYCNLHGLWKTEV